MCRRGAPRSTSVARGAWRAGGAGRRCVGLLSVAARCGPLLQAARHRLGRVQAWAGVRRARRPPRHGLPSLREEGFLEASAVVKASRTRLGFARRWPRARGSRCHRLRWSGSPEQITCHLFASGSIPEPAGKRRIAERSRVAPIAAQSVATEIIADRRLRGRTPSRRRVAEGREGVAQNVRPRTRIAGLECPSRSGCPPEYPSRALPRDGDVRAECQGAASRDQRVGGRCRAAQKQCWCLPDGRSIYPTASAVELQPWLQRGP